MGFLFLFLYPVRSSFRPPPPPPPPLPHNFVTHTTPSFIVTHNFITHHLWSHHLVISTSFCVARVALMRMGGIWWRAWGPLVARGAAVLCVAGVALAHIDLRFCVAGMALMALGWVCTLARLVAVGRPWHRGTLRGRRGTWRHTGVSRGSSAWQAWHLWHFAGGALGRRWSPVTPRHFAWHGWQARHLATSTGLSRGRRGTCSHPPSFCVAGVALMALGWVWWRAWSLLVARDAAALCVHYSQRTKSAGLPA